MFQTAHAHGSRVGCHHGSEQSHSLVTNQSACAGTPSTSCAQARWSHSPQARNRRAPRGERRGAGTARARGSNRIHRGPSRPRPALMARLAIVQVASHSRHRQHVSTVMTFASVSMILPPHCGHALGRVAGFMNCVSGIVLSVHSKLPYPSTSSFASHMASTIAITIVNVLARFCLSRSRRAPTAIHCAQR
jgi:hypothetical protein